MTPTKDLDEASAHQDEWAEHERTYKGFVRGVVLFAAHVLVVLLICGATLVA